jgi:large subunit ribosomal protein L24
MKKKQPEPPRKIRIRKGDIVKVIAGRDKGKSGRVIEVGRKTGRLLVEGVMLIKKHTRPNPQRQIKGGIAERESTIHASNVMIVTSSGEASRIGFREPATPGGRRVRFAKKTDEVLDKKG